MRLFDDRRTAYAASSSRARGLLVAGLAVALAAAGLGLWRGHATPSSSLATSSAPSTSAHRTRPTPLTGGPSVSERADTGRQPDHDPAPPELPNKFVPSAFAVPASPSRLQPVGADDRTTTRRTDSPVPRVPVGASPAAAQRLTEESRLTDLQRAPGPPPPTPGPSAVE